MILLNVGSGDHPARVPWLNVDSYPGTGPDVVADVRSLPYEDGIVTAVYCGHLLEHLSLDDGVPRAVAEIRRVLTPTGRACFVGPDYQRAQAFNDPVLLDVIRDGGRRWPGDRHRWVATVTIALNAVRREFPDATETPIETLDAFWPVVSRVAWQFAITTSSEEGPVHRDRLDEAAELADELGISRSEARRLIATDSADRARARSEHREHRMPERAIPYDNKETR